MTNKELAVQLYIAFLQANAAITASPNFSGSISQIPTVETMVKTVEEIAAQLSSIKDN